MSQNHSLPLKTVLLISTSLYGFSILIACLTSRLDGFQTTSYLAIFCSLIGWASTVLRFLRPNRFSLILFVSFQPLFFLLYLSFFTLYVLTGKIDTAFVLLTVTLYAALWLIPILFQNFAQTYAEESVRPKELWARILFRYLLLPLLILAPAGVRGVLVLDRFIVQTTGSLSLRAYATFAMLLLAFSLQLSFITQTWSYIVNPSHSPQPKTRRSMKKRRQ